MIPNVKHEKIEVNGQIKMKITEDSYSLYLFLKSLHEELIHPGIVVMEKTLSRYFILKGMRKIIAKICRECLICNTEKEFASKYGNLRHDTDITDVNEVLAIDIKGPIKSVHFDDSTLERDFYILVAVDVFSRYTEVGFIFYINSKTVCDKLEKIWFQKHERPKIYLTNKGRQFTSNNFGAIIKKYNMKHVRSAPHNPTGNGIVERINKEIGTVLRISRQSGAKELKSKI